MSAKERGMTFVEVLVSMFLVVIVMFGLLSLSNTAYSSTRHNMDREFATQKAISILEELKSLVQVAGNSATILDYYDDGVLLEPVLTTDLNITNPADPASGNSAIGGGNWKYLRQVSVTLLPGTSDTAVRLVNVRICISADNNQDGQPDTIAQVAGVIRTIVGIYPQTQVYDVYALAVENVPGWWVYMANLIPFMQSAVQDLEGRNPGMEFRVHWITHLSYGRDSQYRPQVNNSVDSNTDINSVYFYPGLMPTGSAVNYYYPPNNFDGHVSIDAANTNDFDSTLNPLPYALADQYNNSMRYPDEVALYNSRVAAGLDSADSPTLRILLEQLYQHPENYTNAIFINLHGELFPFPPIRNYSDPAKDPTNFANIRVVTHPERLRYLNTATSVKLRVYSYRTDPDNASAATSRAWLGQSVGTPVPINITLKGVTWTPSAGDIATIRGGVDQNLDGTLDPYTSASATTTASTNGTYYAVTTSGGDTIISLYNSPLKQPELLVSGSNYAGLNTNSRLYGLEYIPAPFEDLTPSSSPPTAFTANLLSTHTISGGVCNGGVCETNTARWLINIPDSVLPGGVSGNGMLTVETRINSTTSGTRTSTPPNLSRTYVWRGTNTWIFGNGTAANPPNLPLTESYQILGDPRHNPYADLKAPHLGSGLPAEDALGMGYNRYFDDFENGTVNAASSTYWAGYNYTVSGVAYGVKNDTTVDNDGWKAVGTTNFVDIDMHRVYQVLRRVLTNSKVVWTTMTGYSYYYIGIGNEIGYDSANGFTNSIPVSTKLTTGVTGTTYEQSILPSSGDGVKWIKESSGGTYWWGMWWLGELYPDSMYATWTSTGNLPTGTTASTFVRTLRDSVTVNLPRGTTLVKAGHRSGPEGSTTFYWTGSSGSTWHHTGSTGTGNLLAGGNQIASRYNFPMSSGININRPFNVNINNTGANPDAFLQGCYGPVYTDGFLQTYYDHSVQTSDYGSALLTMADTNNHVAFIGVNGISMTGTSGSSFIADYSLLTLIQSYLQSGLYNPGNAYANHVEQLPRISVTSPNANTNLNDPATVTIGWTREWKRWDGQSYTPSYASNYAETTAVSYQLLYSSDNGATWKHIQDNTAAMPGVKGVSGYLISTASASPTYTWTTPTATFPTGRYIIRVEAYRDVFPQHYAYHMYPAFIRRP